jgi:hypothetical protein
MPNLGFQIHFFDEAKVSCENKLIFIPYGEYQFIINFLVQIISIR